MPKQSEFSKGYQAALADITAAIENARDNRFDRNLQLAAVENWIKNNTIIRKPPAEHRVRNVNGGSRYRGYFFSQSPDGAYRVWFGNSVSSDNYVEDAIDVKGAKSKIDSYLEGK